jgi:hypothetical protein
MLRPQDGPSWLSQGLSDYEATAEETGSWLVIQRFGE